MAASHERGAPIPGGCGWLGTGLERRRARSGSRLSLEKVAPEPGLVLARAACPGAYVTPTSVSACLCETHVLALVGREPPGGMSTDWGQGTPWLVELGFSRAPAQMPSVEATGKGPRAVSPPSAALTTTKVSTRPNTTGSLVPFSQR